MSLFLNYFLKTSFSCNQRLFLPCRQLHSTQVRLLYAPATIGIDGYLQARKNVKEQFVNFSEKFKTKMNDFVSDSKNMIFTEDLKNMVHLAEPSDLQLVLNMIKKFNTQSTEFRFGSFVFGPVVMRMFHFLDAPKEALQCFEEPANDGFFDQQVSYQILLDLLYCHEMFDEMYRVFEKVQKKQINMTKFPKYCVVLIMAACYKENTPKSLEYATKLWSDMASTGTLPLRRAATSFAGLALKQGAPHIALESISGQRQHYITIRNIKAMALADMGRVDDAIPILRSVLNIDSPDQKDKHTFFEETISKVGEAVEKTNNKDTKIEFEDVRKALIERGLIDKDTLDSHLNFEIKIQNKFKDAPRGMPFQSRNHAVWPTKN